MYYLDKAKYNYKILELQAPKRLLEKVEFKQAAGGPPVGAPVFIEISGDEFDTLLEISNIVKNELMSTEYVYDIRDTWEEGAKEMHLIVDEKKASLAQVSVFQIASSLQMAFSGQVVSSIKKIDEEIDIRVQFLENYRKRLSSLKEVYVRNQLGNLVPITEIASFERKTGLSVISHFDNNRTIAVMASLDERKTSSLAVNDAVLASLKPVMSKYPGYNVKAGGEYEDTQESLASLGQSFILALMGIMVILVFLFGNLRNAFIILCTIPLGIVGVIFAFYLHKVLFIPDLTFSFLAFLGFIGLTGVVVNDSIILVNYMSGLVQKGMDLKEAALQGGLRRLRPVIITTITTLAGVLPTAYGIGGSDPFLKANGFGYRVGFVFCNTCYSYSNSFIILYFWEKEKIRQISFSIFEFFLKKITKKFGKCSNFFEKSFII